MKKILSTLCLIAYVLLNSGCDDSSFSPKANFAERYVLTCVVDITKDIQTATLSRSYNVEGNDPFENTMDPVVTGAEIKIIYKDSAYVMTDTICVCTDDSRYSTPYKYYYVEGLKPDRGEILELVATMPNGEVLHSTTQTPIPTNFFFGDSDTMIPPSRGHVISSEYNISWAFNGKALPYFFVPRLFIVYYIKNDNTFEKLYKEIPVDYIKEGDNYVPIYPTGQKWHVKKFYTSAIDRAMLELSGDDPNKSNYYISHALIQVLSLDVNLAAYYGVQQIKSDGFSVRLDAAEYTNIEGGLGVFGSYNSVTYPISIISEYIVSYGYKIANFE